jgi:hypothetical protein
MVTSFLLDQEQSAMKHAKSSIITTGGETLQNIHTKLDTCGSVSIAHSSYLTQVKRAKVHTWAVYCYSSTAVHLAVHKKSCLCTQTFRRCFYINLSVSSGWTYRTFPEVLMVERAALRAFLVGVVGRFSQGPLMHIFRFFFGRTIFPGFLVFFPRHPFCCFFLFSDLHLTLAPARHKPPPYTPLHTCVPPYPPLPFPPIHVSVVHEQPPQNLPPHA